MDFVSDISYKYTAAMSDKAIIEMIGEFIKYHRLDQNMTQSEIAEVAGVHRTTIVEIEKGNSTSILTLIQVLRMLGQLHIFNEFKIEPKISPILLAEADMKRRKRAYVDKRIIQKKKSDW